MGKELPRFEEPFLPHLDAAYNLARWMWKGIKTRRMVGHDKTRIVFVL